MRKIILSIIPGLRGKIKSRKEICWWRMLIREALQQKNQHTLGSERHLETICWTTEMLIQDTSLQRTVSVVRDDWPRSCLLATREGLQNFWNWLAKRYWAVSAYREQWPPPRLWTSRGHSKSFSFFYLCLPLPSPTVFHLLYPTLTMKEWLMMEDSQSIFFPIKVEMIF